MQINLSSIALIGSMDLPDLQCTPIILSCRIQLLKDRPVLNSHSAKLDSVPLQLTCATFAGVVPLPKLYVELSE